MYTYMYMYSIDIDVRIIIMINDTSHDRIWHNILKTNTLKYRLWNTWSICLCRSFHGFWYEARRCLGIIHLSIIICSSFQPLLTYTVKVPSLMRFVGLQGDYTVTMRAGSPFNAQYLPTRHFVMVCFKKKFHVTMYTTRGWSVFWRAFGVMRFQFACMCYMLWVWRVLPLKLYPKLCLKSNHGRRGCCSKGTWTVW